MAGKDSGRDEDLGGAATETSPDGLMLSVPPRSSIRDAVTPLERPRDSEGNPRQVSSWPRQKALAAGAPPNSGIITAGETETPTAPDSSGPAPSERIELTLDSHVTPFADERPHTGKTEHTMRSVDTPRPMSRQPWDERRIGTVELEIEHLQVSVKLLEKSLERAQLEARLRSLVLLVVVAVALLARVL